MSYVLPDEWAQFERAAKRDPTAIWLLKRSLMNQASLPRSRLTS